MIEQPDDSLDQSCQKPSNVCEVQNGVHRFVFRIPNDEAEQQLLMETAMQYARDRDVPFTYTNVQTVIAGVHHFQEETGKHVAACVHLTGDRGRQLHS